MRNRVLASGLSALAIALLAAPARAADRKVSAQELSQRGFFTDFDEIDLGSLLGETSVQVAVAARRDERLREASGTVTLITADEIRAHGLRTLDEALRFVPGFDVVADSLGRSHIVVRGVTGGRTGGASESVLILLDGHRLNEDLHGGATVANLAISITSLRRIEILRGPASALYGEAAGAVINLISEDPTTAKPEDPPRLSLTAGDGSFGQQQMAMNLGGRTGPVMFVGHLQYTDTSGAALDVPLDAQSVRDYGAPRPAVSLAPGRTTDRVRGLESIYRISFRSFDVLWRMKQEQSGGFIGANDALGTQNNIDNRQLVLDASYKRMLQAGTLTTTASFTRTRLNETLEVIPPGLEQVVDGRALRLSSVFLQTELGTMRTSLESRYDRTFEAHEVLAGVIVERESTFGLEARGNVDFRTFRPREAIEPLEGSVAESDRNIFGLWLSDKWSVRSKTTLTGALRVEHVSGLGMQLSPRLVLIQQLPRALTLRLSYARAYRAPSFRELAFDLAAFEANPDLRVSSQHTIEAGLAHHADDFDAAASVYFTRVCDNIRAEGVPSFTTPAPLVNGEGVDVAGLELEARRFFGRHHAFLAYSYQNPQDVATDRRVAGISGHLATLGGSLAVDDRLSIMPTVILRSSKPRDAGDERPDLAGHAVLNLAVRRTFLQSKKLELRAILNNALDQGYHDPAPAWGVPGDYPRPGRSLFVDAKYRF